jgi:crossover junction endodeoxyribonuclease RusA
MITITLPWPPSVNHYWRTWRGRMLISRQGRAYRKQVGVLLRAAEVTPQAGALAVHVELYPPDRRKRDVDNTFKAIGDSLQHGGAFQDDSQIVWLLLEKAEVVAGGKVIVRIAERTGDPLAFPTSERVCLN